MTQKLLQHVEVILEPDGSTEVHIPPPCFWDCVECFGENRLDASFTFAPPHFVAHLRHTSPPRIFEMLNNWSKPEVAAKVPDRFKNARQGAPV